MLVQRVTQFSGLVVGEALNMVEMGAGVEVDTAAPLMDLCEVVVSHGEFAGVQILKVLWGAELAGLGEGVAADVVVPDELLLQGVREVNEGGAAVGELGVAAGTLRRQLDGAEEGETGSSKVVAGIGMEELVALEKTQLIPG